MDLSLRLSAAWGRVIRALWFWPAVSILAAIVAGLLLVEVRPSDAGGLARFGGTPEGARAMLSTVAGSIITVTGLTFSLTVVALQVASSQFTPRLLSTFLADRGNQAVLSVFLGTFAYTLTVQRSVRSPTADDPGFVPDLAVGVGLLLTLASVGMLVYFFHHITQQLRLETVLDELRRDTLAAVRRTRPDGSDDDAGTEDELPEVPRERIVVRARRSGYLQAIRLQVLGRVATEHGVAVRLAPAVGVHVTAGTTLGWAWAVDDDAPIDDERAEALARAVHGAIHLGSDRTLDEDVAFGIRQLVDIAARALSPGINDPTSAVSAIDAMAVVCSQLARSPAQPAVYRDDAGRVRAALSASTFGELLGLACDQPRRYGREEPALLTALLRMLTDVAESCRYDDRLAAVRDQIDATVARAEDAELSSRERGRVERVARQARAACRYGERMAHLEPEDDDDQPAT